MRPLLFFCMLSLLVPTSEGQSDLSTRIDSVATAALENGPIAGLSIAVMQGEKIVHAEGYGFADVENNVPASADTRYPTASAGKHLTAVIVLSLIEAGYFHLEDHVTDLLPNFPNPDQGNVITVKQLLSHTSGLSNFTRTDTLAIDEPRRSALLTETLYAYLRDRPLDFPPGTQYRYSNSGFYLLGLIAEKASKRPFSSLMEEFVTRPLDLKTVGPIVASDTVNVEVSRTYLVEDDRFRRTAFWERMSPTADNLRVPAGFMRASVLDLARFMSGLNDGSLLPLDAVRKMREPTRLASGTSVSYGLGTRIGAIEGHRKIGHTGGIDSYRSVLAYYPDNDVTIAVLINTELDGSTSTDALSIEAAVAHLLLGPSKTVSVIEPLDEGQLASYEGAYLSIYGDTIRVRVENNRLVTSSGTIYSYQGNHTFQSQQWPTWQLHFDVQDGVAATIGATDGGWAEADFVYERIPSDRHQRLSSRIDSLAQSALNEGPIAGLSVAVVRRDEVVHASGYGLADIETGVSATAETIYDIGSVGKILTAIAILTLVDDGHLSLEDDLTSLLPSFPNAEQGRTISMRQLLNHTSGLNDYVDADRERWYSTSEPLTASFVLDYVRDRPLDFEPGSNYNYTNTGFYLAGLIIEHATGQRWSDYVLDTVTKPLGLSSFALCDDVVGQSASGYDVTDDGFVRTQGEYVQLGIQGDGGLCSNARDLARLPHALSASNLLTESSLDALLSSTTLSNSIDVDYGLGVARGVLEGHPLWGHLGGAEGSLIATLFHFPEDSVTVAVLVNSLFGSVGPLDVTGSVSREVLELGKAVLMEEVISDDKLEVYAGEYVRVGGTNFRLGVDSGKLAYFTLDSDEPGTHFPFIGNHMFGIYGYPMDRMIFHFNSGKTTGYSLYLNGIFTGLRMRLDQ